MYRTILTLFLLFSFFAARSQKIYFIYLQTENEQPFFLKMGERVQSSTASGYLILSKLKDSTYNFSIGFPQDKWPEQHYSVIVNRKDQGFLIKNFGEKGWGLFDLQTLGVQMSSSEKVKAEKASTENKEVSHFTDVLAKAANDPSLRERTIVTRTEEKKPETVLAVVKTESSKAAVIKQTEITESSVKTEEPNKNTVIKTVEMDTATSPRKSEAGVEEKKPPITRNDGANNRSVQKESNKAEEKIVSSNGVSEINTGTTVKKEDPKIEINQPIAPVLKNDAGKIDSVVKAESNYKSSVVTKRSESSTTEGFGVVFIDAYESGAKDTVRILIPNSKPLVNEIKEEPREEKKFLDISSDTASKKQNNASQSNNSLNKNKCTDLANEDDFLKLRKRMTGMTNDEAMVNEAKKTFKAKCFSVDQVKKLSAMFWNEQGKYQFFDAAYLFVSDAENFVALQKELKDPYYINRFKAMLRN